MPSTSPIHDWKPRRLLPQPRAAMLLVLLFATLVMPVSYRAGDAHTHAHPVFQGLIDAIVGHHHHHDEATSHHDEDASALAASPFANLAIPLSLTIPATPDVMPASEPDEPQIFALSMPISSASAIEALGLLVVSLLAGMARRPLWSRAQPLTGWILAIERPPPRPA